MKALNLNLRNRSQVRVAFRLFFSTDIMFKDKPRSKGRHRGLPLLLPGTVFKLKTKSMKPEFPIPVF